MVPWIIRVAGVRAGWVLQNGAAVFTAGSALFKERHRRRYRGLDVTNAFSAPEFQFGHPVVTAWTHSSCAVRRLDRMSWFCPK